MLPSAAEPVLVRTALCAPLAAPTTVAGKFRLEGARLAPGALPVPVRVTIWEPPLASSVTVTVPVRVPVAVGVKVTPRLQLLPAGTTVQLPLVAKSPVAAMPLMCRSEVPVLRTVTVWPVLVVPTTCPPNTREVGVTSTPGAVPLPVSETNCGDPGALSLICSEPVRLPTAVGENVTLTVHVPLAATDGQFAEAAKSPLAVTPLTCSVPPLVLVISTVCAALVVPTG